MNYISSIKKAYRDHTLYEQINSILDAIYVKNWHGILPIIDNVSYQDINELVRITYSFLMIRTQSIENDDLYEALTELAPFLINARHDYVSPVDQDSEQVHVSSDEIERIGESSDEHNVKIFDLTGFEVPASEITLVFIGRLINFAFKNKDEAIKADLLYDKTICELVIINKMLSPEDYSDLYRLSDFQKTFRNLGTKEKLELWLEQYDQDEINDLIRIIKLMPDKENYLVSNLRHLLRHSEKFSTIIDQF